VSARLVRYSRELARDFLVERGIAILLILGIFTYAHSVASADEWAAFAAPASRQTLTRFAAKFASSNLLLVALIAYTGLVANDRKAGYTRFLFAKPLDPVAYYVAKYLVHGGMLLACFGVWALVMAVSRQGFDPIPLALTAGVRLFLFAGMLVLASAVGRLEFVWFGVAYIGGFVLRLLASSWHWPESVAHYVAPWTALDRFDMAVQAGRRVTMLEAGYPVAYGLICLAVAMFVVRRRPLAG
jgi:hypothetical protein